VSIKKQDLSDRMTDSIKLTSLMLANFQVYPVIFRGFQENLQELQKCYSTGHILPYNPYKNVKAPKTT